VEIIVEIIVEIYNSISRKCSFISK